MAASQYATVANLATMFDERALAELSSDDDSDGTVGESNDILLGAIYRASADVEMAVKKGGRYTSDQLDALQAATDWGLIGLVCDLAVANLFNRRGMKLPSSVRDRKNDAEDKLRMLANGELVFGQGDEQIGAGKPDLTVIATTVRGQIGMVSDSSFFPMRRGREY